MSDEVKVASSWCRYLRDKRFSRKQKHQILDHVGCPSILYGLSANELQHHFQISTASTKPLKKVQAGWMPMVEGDMAWLTCSDEHSLITFSDERYPEQLRQIPDPPLALFAIGDICILNQPIVSVVGSRRPSQNGLLLCQQISSELADVGIAVCSGMALGIDAQAHHAALECNAGTVAVLGGGVDVIYPSRHKQLYEKIAQKGLLLSEYPPSTVVSKYTFPERNRIISGLSLGVLIIEAAVKSGTLITARCAIEQAKEVFVVPGSPQNPQYHGSHQLIQNGALLVSCTEDIVLSLSQQMQQYITSFKTQQKISQEACDVRSLDIKLQGLLDSIEFDVSSVDTIIARSGMSAEEVSSALLLLEMQEYVALDSNGGYFRLK